MIQKSPMRQSHRRSPLKNIGTNDSNIEKVQQSHNTSNNSMDSNNNQYFSFSRERNEYSVES
jgi:hypothetical protein